MNGMTRPTITHSRVVLLVPPDPDVAALAAGKASGPADEASRFEEVEYAVGTGPLPFVAGYELALRRGHTQRNYRIADLSHHLTERSKGVEHVLYVHLKDAGDWTIYPAPPDDEAP